jgi:hypothetical protein
MDFPFISVGPFVTLPPPRPARRTKSRRVTYRLPSITMRPTHPGGEQPRPRLVVIHDGNSRRQDQPRCLRRSFGPHSNPASSLLLTSANSRELRHLTPAQRAFIIRGTRAVNDRIVHESVQPKTNEDRDRTWRRWIGFCSKAGIVDRLLVGIPDSSKELIIRSFLCAYQVSHWDKSGRILGTNPKALAGTTSGCGVSGQFPTEPPSRLGRLSALLHRNRPLQGHRQRRRPPEAPEGDNSQVPPVSPTVSVHQVRPLHH